jgi:Uma2 family endonuclease
MDTATPTTARTPGIVIGRRLRIPGSALTLDGFLRWAHSPRFPERGKVSFVNGEVHLEMSLEEVRTHNSVKRDLIVDLTPEARRRDLGQVFVDGVLLVNEAAELATEPDLMLCLWPTLESEKVKLVERDLGTGRLVELHGSPDLVVEIVSRSSVKKDTVELRASYHRAGVAEYWIVDARKAAFQFRVLHWQPDGYREATATASGRRPSLVLQAEVELTRRPDRIGGWQYALQIG